MVLSHHPASVDGLNTWGCQTNFCEISVLTYESCPFVCVTSNLKTPCLSTVQPLAFYPRSIHQDLSTFLSQVVSTGGGGHVQLLTRAMAQMTYCSLCPPDDLANRGLLRIPSALYAQDALQLWKVTAR